ncbi:Hypothetical protein CINCED_3A018365 [Cinara cedri]|uniref:Uncharacterized protein n=1 Tax=Cinara cedri TaxID=506608 RepID=A0A5E4MFE9_9HEMI|nr:Hypothetical protein CINCED_3A018365 [Cinara cedri]
MNTFTLLYLFSCLLIVFHEVTSEVEIRDITDEPENKPIHSKGEKIDQSKGYQRQSPNNESKQYYVEEPVSQEDESKMQLGSNEDLKLHDDQGYLSEQNITPLGIFAVYDWWSKMPQSGLNQIHATGHGAGSSMDPVTRARILKANITPKGMEILQEWLRDIPIMDLDQSEDEKRKGQTGESDNGPIDIPIIKHSTSKSNGEMPSNTDNTPVQDLKLPGLEKSKPDVNNSAGEPNNYVMRKIVYHTDDHGNQFVMRRTEARFEPGSEANFPNYNIPELSRPERPYDRRPTKMYSHKRKVFPEPLFDPPVPSFFSAPPPPVRSIFRHHNHHR